MVAATTAVNAVMFFFYVVSELALFLCCFDV
jgi:hypothetical protein